MQRSGCLQEGQRNVQMRIRRVDKHGNWSECKIWKKCGSTEMVSEVAYELKIYNQRNTEGLLPGFLRNYQCHPPLNKRDMKVHWLCMSAAETSASTLVVVGSCT